MKTHGHKQSERHLDSHSASRVDPVTKCNAAS
jgi:hypothetical protein